MLIMLKETWKRNTRRVLLEVILEMMVIFDPRLVTFVLLLLLTASVYNKLNDVSCFYTYCKPPILGPSLSFVISEYMYLNCIYV